MEEEIKAPVTETVEEVKDAVAAAEETEVKETAEAAAEETEVSPAPAEEPAESMADYEAEIDASLRRYEKDEKVKCTVISVDVDKVMVELGSTTGIIRKQDASDDPSYNLQENIKPGDEIEATVLRSDDGHGHVVLSMKAAAAAKAWDRLTSLLESKDSVEVKITGVTKAGVITMLEGVRGFIPASKLSLGYIAEDELPNWIGKTIETRVITAEKEGRKLVLSAKEILREKEAQERKDAAALVKVGLVTEGVVETIKDYGAFVNLGKGVTGLLHVSQISQKRIKTPSEVLEQGQKVKVKVTKVADGRISLSMKALEESAAPEAAEEKEEITFKLPKSESIGTGLGALLKGLKLD
ncbi:MAG: S1 RNA-binding domain-containing protein [Lachnospiraceae bacterium]|nr:S1 RNA-binding domain-containing protein [Lachnospiraceae bacterium]